MDWQRKMNQAVEYIEEHLIGVLALEIAAKAAGSSVWEFQRIFSFIAHTSIGEYIRKRKMSLAANDLVHSREKIIDIAMKYGYESPAAFPGHFIKRTACRLHQRARKAQTFCHIPKSPLQRMKRMGKIK